MDRRFQLVKLHNEAVEQQRIAGQNYRAFRDADMPLLAEIYIRECAQLVTIILDCIDQLQQMDRQERLPRAS
jgi:hypothetical protein